ncbi:MAG: hypothetical protein HFG73_00485 [Hungatella sp.]|nr:hypothetical protein [Hungatella sp.]
MAHSRKKLNLAGQKYKKLTVLCPADNVGTKTAWLCRCECGKELVVKTCYLRSGHVGSCGCEGAERAGGGLASLTYIDGTCVEMLKAGTVRRNNTSGVPGVDWRASKGTWRASICFKGRRYYLGCYHRFEDAVEARKRAEEEMHGGFLRELAMAQGHKAENQIFG